MPTSPWKHFESVRPDHGQPIFVRITGPWRPPIAAAYDASAHQVVITEPPTWLSWWECYSWKSYGRTLAPTTTTLSTSTDYANGGAVIAECIYAMDAVVHPSYASGYVTFFDGTQALATIPLVNGTAHLEITAVAGTHTYTAAYPGDTRYASSVSAPLSLWVLNYGDTVNCAEFKAWLHDWAAGTVPTDAIPDALPAADVGGGLNQVTFYADTGDPSYSLRISFTGAVWQAQGDCGCSGQFETATNSLWDPFDFTGGQTPCNGNPPPHRSWTLQPITP